jgi:hypothetical protein
MVSQIQERKQKDMRSQPEQLGQGSAHCFACRNQEDYEALQHARLVQAHIP